MLKSQSSILNENSIQINYSGRIQTGRRARLNWKIIPSIASFLLAIYANSITFDSYLYILQSFVTALLAFMLLTKNKSAFILVLSMMFIAGNWLKVTVHKIYDYKYVEPIGYFTGTKSEWSAFYSYSTIITAILIIATIISSLKRYRVNTIIVKKDYSKFVYHAAILSTCILYSVNSIFGIYRIGLGSKIELPLGLTAPIAFLIFSGTPLIIALSADIHVRKNKRVSIIFMFSLIFAFIIASISTFSRALFIVQLLPILIGMYVKSKRLGNTDLSVSKIALPFIAGMVGALILVSAQRIVEFSDDRAINQISIERYFNETTGLFVDRWVGAESMMVASSTNGNEKLFFDLLNENPKNGVFNIYHGLSNSNYYYIDGKTFLNLPGYFAILSLSGSFFIIAIGAMLCCIIGIFFEKWISIKFGNSETMVYTSCTILAYHFSQMAFPLLFIPFIIQMVGFLYILEFVTSMSVRHVRNKNINNQI